MKKEASASAPSAILRVLSHPEYAPWIGLFRRLFLAWFLPWLLDDGRWLPGVSYTDIDFLVFTDAAEYLKRGMSPYDRHTYRYTPFLAELLSRFPTKEFGRYFFCVADALCGYIILHERRARRNQQQLQQDRLQKRGGDATDDNGSLASPLRSVELIDASLWLYNPLAINICTRGSSESLMVLLPVLLTFWIATGKERQQQYTEDAEGSNSGNDHNGDNDNDGTATYLQILLAGICHGVAIHSKLYPVIYSLSYMAYFATPPRSGPTTPASNVTAKTSTFPWTNPSKLLRLAKLWIGRLLFSSKPLLFLGAFLVTFGFLTWLAVYIYGEIALQEGLLYHFSRVDHRHNYSMYWYWIYLARARTADAATAKAATTAMASAVDAATSSGLFSLATLGRLLLVPQAFLLAFSSVGMAPHNGQLGLTLFLQTYLFVTHNKVITAQYFTWYLCLLPLCNSTSGGLLKSRKVVRASIMLGVSILLWLGSAYGLEMQGLRFHRIVWFASVLYFFANVNMMGALLESIGSGKENSSNNKFTDTADDFKKKN
jgi:phosphatidylinositol glycan class M